MKKVFFSLLCSIVAFAAMAQEVYSSSGRPITENERNGKKEREKGFDPSRMIYGGGFIFGIGGGVTNLGVSPVVGYAITDKFSAGVGIGYQYLGIKDMPVTDQYNYLVGYYDLKTSIYTGNVWARYLVFQNVFVHVQPEINSLERFGTATYDPTSTAINVNKERVLVPSLLAGLGLRQPVSDRVSILATALYDVLQEPNSPYRNTIDLRIGVAVGF
ncbi:MAG: hypothetical protein EOP51_06855 [Sphingobacteriales bacterium]|nr:MAG: hypothetical protein EOP51_06855 [Sphingobacteriales bacterium]